MTSDGFDSCGTCGFRWRHGKASIHSCTAMLKEEIDVTDKLLAERERVLKAIPACEAHGASCVPHAVEWVEQALKIRAAAVAVLATKDGTFARIDAVHRLSDAVGPNAAIKPPVLRSA